MEWKRYIIQEFAPNKPLSDEILPRTPRCIVEAPSPGVAIEFFLAIHGLLSYYTIFLDETDMEADETRDDLLHLIPDAEEKVAVLDSHHVWTSWKL